MNVKKFFLILFVAAVLCPLYSQQNKDVILAVDTSSSMFSYYNEAAAYLSGPFLAENVAAGDTVHIISFGSKPRFELARRIQGSGDIEAVCARIWLLYPLDPGSDPASAIGYTEQYIRSIQGGRPKKVFIVSGSDISGEVSTAAERFRPEAELQFIQAGSRMSTALSAGAAVSGTAGVAAGASGGTAETTSAGEAAGDTQSGGTGSNSDQGPGGTGTGADSTGNGFETTTAGGFMFSNVPLAVWIGGALLLLLLLLLLIFRIRKIQSSPEKAIARIGAESNAANTDAELLNSFASRQAESSLQNPHRRYQYKGTSDIVFAKPPVLSIFVEGQTTATGRRNVHALKKGASYTVGGGNSDFLIFLVHFPPRLGRIYFDGTNCTFFPLRSEYFPDIGSAKIPECIGKPIRIVSGKNYEVFFHFEPYRDPLVEMNQLLNSINVPEPPSRPEDLPAAP